MSAKLWVQWVAAIAAGGLTFPNMEKKDSDLFRLILYTSPFMASGMSGKDILISLCWCHFKGRQKVWFSVNIWNSNRDLRASCKSKPTPPRSLHEPRERTVRSSHTRLPRRQVQSPLGPPTGLDCFWWETIRNATSEQERCFEQTRTGRCSMLKKSTATKTHIILRPTFGNSLSQ